MVALETPVLSVAIDAVSKVDGENALCGLITLFSKCKAGIQDGPRLENMAWRLWQVGRFERSPSTHLCFPASPGASSPGGIASPITSCPSSASSSDSASPSSGSECSDQENGECWDKDELTAVGSKPSPLLVSSPTPLHDARDPKQYTHAHNHVHTHPLERRKTDMSLSASPPSRRNLRERSHSRDRDEDRHPAHVHHDGPPSDRRPSFPTRRTHSNTSVGKIMADLLPEKLDVMQLESRRRRPSNSSTTSAVSDATAAIGLGLTTKDLSEEDRWRASSTTLVRDEQEPELVTVALPDVNQQVPQPQQHPPPQQSGDPAQLTLDLDTGSLLVTDSANLPNVVIVHPTPHPTPPMTPQTSMGSGLTDRSALIGAVAGTASAAPTSDSASLAPATAKTPAASASSAGQVNHSRDQRERERERDSLTVPTRAQARQAAHLLVFTDQRTPSSPSSQAQCSNLANTSVIPTSTSGPEKLSPAKGSDTGGSANLQNLHMAGGLQTSMANSQPQEPVLSQSTSNIPHPSLSPGQMSNPLRTSETRSSATNNSNPNAISNLDCNANQSSQSPTSGSNPSAGLTTVANGGQALHPNDHQHEEHDRKFFISGSNAGSQDGDSPETSASSQIGSHSVVSGSVSVSNSGFTGEPASVASRTSTASQAKSTSSGRTGSSRGGLKMKARNGDVKGKGKGKGKEAGLGAVQFANHPPVRRSVSGHRISQQVGDLGTMHRSILGGRTAAAMAHNSGIRQPSNLMHVIHQPMPRIQPQQPQTSTASRQSQEPNKPVSGPGPSSTAVPGVGGLKSPVSSGSGRRNSSQSRSRTSNGNRGASTTTGLKAGAPSTSNKHKIDVVDDSEYSTDEEDWDTEEGSEEVEGGDGATDDGHQPQPEGQLAEAAAEAQRHRDLFAKVDRRSYTQLVERPQSGLLSQIFHPPPERFPLDHPYRYSRSTQDILAHVTQGPARNLYMPGAMTAMQVQPKSSIAMPTPANVVAQGVGSPNNTRKSPLRKPPQDAEMESDSGDDTENKLDMSKSLAQRKLQEHMTRSSSRQRQQQQAQPSQNGQQTQQRLPPHQELPRNSTFANPTNPPYTHQFTSGLHTVATAPIDLGYPYNLPPPMPPSTPRTTRRHFLTNELSESLRRNLLWERQVSKRPMGTRRPATAIGGIRPLTALNGQNGNVAQANGNPPTNEQAQQQQAQEARRLARNKSWQEDFHGAGW